jgi:hypothetical protein
MRHPTECVPTIFSVKNEDLDDIVECLSGPTMITSSTRSGPGISLRSNLTHIMQSLLDMQEAVVGYTAHNPQTIFFEYNPVASTVGRIDNKP